MINCTTSEQPIQARYVRDYINGNTLNTSNHWVEVQVYDKNGTNVALNKSVTTMQGSFTEDKLNYVTDGDLDTGMFLDGGATGLKEIQIDLGAVY